MIYLEEGAGRSPPPLVFSECNTFSRGCTDAPQSGLMVDPEKRRNEGLGPEPMKRGQKAWLGRTLGRTGRECIGLAKKSV